MRDTFYMARERVRRMRRRECSGARERAVRACLPFNDFRRLLLILPLMPLRFAFTP